MRAVAGNAEVEQRHAWAEYTERLRGLEGPEYDREEAAAWARLQATLRDLGIEVATDDAPPV